MLELNSIHIFVFILGAFIIILQLHVNKNEFPENSVTSGPNILIAVISARDHFSQRKALRNSWLQSVKEYENVRYKFFIGKKCIIHPLDRLDKLSCDEGHVPYTFPNKGIISEEDAIGSVPLVTNLHCRNVTLSAYACNTPNTVKNCYSGFGFRVIHPLRLNSIGVRWQLLNGQESLYLVFKDAEEIFENIRINNKSCSKLENGFCFFDLKEKYILPRDFEGMVALSDERSLNSCNEGCWWKSDGTFCFTFGLLNKSYEKYQDERCVNIIANFTLEDKESWKNHMNLKFKRQAEWQQEEDQTDDDLHIEMKSFDDIHYLHNIVDVYRNLPLKVLEMIKWSHSTYPSHYVFKVDDDVEIDVPLLMDWISRELTGRRNLGMWSHFYHHRSVPLFGKWADFEFQGLTYPGFPCGSGYLLSDRLVYLLAMQAPFLKPFQGEDISMGIWAQNLRLGVEYVNKNHVNCWLPSNTCNKSIILPEVITYPSR